MRYWLNGQWLLLLLIQWPLTAIAGVSASDEVQALIDRAEAPEGVVFEIVSGQSRYLDWALPEAARLSMRLREAFPGLDIAIVSHGTEQFALTRERLEHNAPLNSTLAGLNSSQIPVHVCGTYAERRGVAEEAFSDRVDVAAEGPAQINDYLKLGYVRIRITNN